MIRRPPRSTRTDTLFPYTTLFRSKRLRIWRQAETGIVRISPGLEVLGKIVIGIAIAIRPDHPDFFGADAVAQLRQDAKLIADPVYPPIVINDGTAPSRWNHLIDRNIQIGRAHV